MGIASPGNRTLDLRGVNAFVGGPIQHAIEPDAFHGPLRHAIDVIIGGVSAAGAAVFSAHVAEDFGANTALFSPEQVSVRDLDWMRRCDVFIPVMPVLDDGTLLRTDGTHIELGWASALNKPIVLVTRTPVGTGASHLLRGLPSVARVSIVDMVDAVADPTELLQQVALVTREVVMSR